MESTSHPIQYASNESSNDTSLYGKKSSMMEHTNYNHHLHQLITNLPTLPPIHSASTPPHYQLNYDHYTKNNSLPNLYEPYTLSRSHLHSSLINNDSPLKKILTRARLTTTLWEDENTLCYQVDSRGICVARRQDNDMINGTKLLNVAGMSRGKRDGILKNERGRVVVKLGSMHLKGVWIPFMRAKVLASQYKISDLLYPLFSNNPSSFIYPSQLSQLSKLNYNSLTSALENYKSPDHPTSISNYCLSAEYPSSITTTEPLLSSVTAMVSTSNELFKGKDSALELTSVNDLQQLSYYSSQSKNIRYKSSDDTETMADNIRRRSLDEDEYKYKHNMRSLDYMPTQPPAFHSSLYNSTSTDNYYNPIYQQQKSTSLDAKDNNSFW
ncbi:hypothetical protein BDB01DRAFT_778597 [Pilobolus umbonatus]|nr:hypothetical protein BDB01DRAFT_778597 [Pilobolus umbonatus]